MRIAPFLVFLDCLAEVAAYSWVRAPSRTPAWRSDDDFRDLEPGTPNAAGITIMDNLGCVATFQS